MDKKYELLESKKFNRITLYRIKALKDFADVKRGELGGWIESEDNLSHDGDAWVYGNAWVYENAEVYGNARVFGDAWVFGDAEVFGDARVFGNSEPTIIIINDIKYKLVKMENNNDN
jgi:hypothetical protein